MFAVDLLGTTLQKKLILEVKFQSEETIHSNAANQVISQFE